MEERRTRERRQSGQGSLFQAERRKTDRRKLLAGAGLLAAMAVGAPRVVSYIRSVRQNEAAGQVDVSSGNYRILRYDRAALEALAHEAAAAYGVSADLVKAVIET